MRSANHFLDFAVDMLNPLIRIGATVKLRPDHSNAANDKPIVNRLSKFLLAGYLVAQTPAHAANIVAGDVTALLGAPFLFDTASTGGGDCDATVFVRNYNGVTDGKWTAGKQLTLRGIGWASSGSGTTATSATVTFTDLGPDGVVGGGDDVVLGSVTDSLTFAGASEYAWVFSSPVVGTITGPVLSIQITGNANIRRKTTSGNAQDAVKLTLAGSASDPPPPGPDLWVAGYTVGSSQLTPSGQTLFIDNAATGGSDSTFGDGNANWVAELTGLWSSGATVSVKGIAIPIHASGTGTTENGTFTISFYDLGANDSFNGASSETLIATRTATFNGLGTTGTDEYYVVFGQPVDFNAQGSGIAVRFQNSASLRLKVSTPPGGLLKLLTDGGVPGGDTHLRMSLSGTATGGEPPPVTTTATSGGNWDTITWNDGTANLSGNLPDNSIAQFGRHRTVTYRGIPATETVAAINLGETATDDGQATLNVNSGTLNVTGNLTAGRNASANDSFVFANGGMLHVAGNANFGRHTASCDGSLIVAGGTVGIDGDLSMGGFELGGAMLRFQNPGSSPAVDVGGTLTLGRCALDLTFTNAYVHTPGQVITLVQYGSRVGQFANFRDGEEFNCGRNRFRIAYDVGGNSITLTTLPNWPASPNRPNIILLFSDDGGYADQHMQGSNKFPTPELDTLAAAGARFTDAYVTAGVCHPSRCGLLMGRYQQRFGTDNNFSGPSYNGMPVSQRTVPQRLQGLGYRTYGTGKWHLGETVDFHPNCRGFDRWYGAWDGNGSYYGNTDEHSVFQNQMTPQFADENAGDYVTDRIGDATVGFIDEHLASHSDQPFYIYVSFTAIHAPMDTKASDPRFARLQSEFGLDASDYLNSPIVFSGSNQATVDQNRYELAAMTLALDENIGKIMDKLDAEGLASSTLVVYTNDNGGAGWVSGYGGNYSYNTPLRGYKGGSMTDGAIRVPCAAKWPGVIPAGQTITDPVISLDWGATFVNAAGDAPAEARNGLDGIDLMPRLADAVPLPSDRVLCWRAGGKAGSAAARMGDWKMLIPGTGAPVLYNLRSDIDENSNQAAAQPAILSELLARFNAWEARTLPPLYGTADTIEDTGLERQPIAGGLRLKSTTSSPVWISSSLRNSLSLAADFDFAFMIRATEDGSYPANAKLLHGLGDSSTRAELIRFGIDFGNNSLMISNGKAGTSASAPLPSPPASFANATLRYRAATGSLTLSLGGTSVSLVLTGSYGNLTTHAMGVAAMEGEITIIRPVSPGTDGTEATSSVDPGGDPLYLSLDFASEPPFEPRLERSPDLNAFAADPAALLESLGGGRYRSTVPASGLPREFFRYRLNQP